MQPVQRVAAIVENFALGRRESKGTIETRQRIYRAVELEQNDAAIAEGFNVGGRILQAAVVGRQGFVRAAERRQQHRAIVQSGHEIGLGFERAFVTAERLVQALQFLQHDPFVEVCLYKISLEVERAVVARQGKIGAAGEAQCIRHIQVRDRDRWVRLDRPADQFAGLLRRPRLQRHRAQQMQGRGVPRRFGENLQVQILSLGRLAAALTGQRLLEQDLNPLG